MTEIVLAYDRSPATEEEFTEDVDLLSRLMPHIGMVKLGLEAMTAQLDLGAERTSMSVAEAMRDEMYAYDIPVLWDMKLHDIGNTVAGAVRNLAATGKTGWVTVHASASMKALKAAAAARHPVPEEEPLRIFGVTVLTDIDADECEDLFAEPPTEVVTDFAQRLIDAGIDGIVCSGRELEALAQRGFTRHLKTLVPGLRSPWAGTDDQKRVMTPAEAAELGADYLVIGRQILSAVDPIEAARRTREEVDAACRG